MNSTTKTPKISPAMAAALPIIAKGRGCDVALGTRMALVRRGLASQGGLYLSADGAALVDAERDRAIREAREIERVAAEITSRRGLSPDALAYLAASNSKRVDMWNVSSIERRGVFMAAEIRYANDRDTAERECRTCGQTEFATGGDQRCDRCVTKAMAREAEAIEADAIWNAKNVVKPAPGASLETLAADMGLELESGEPEWMKAWNALAPDPLALAYAWGVALVERCERMGHDHSMGYREQVDAEVQLCYLGNFRGLRVVVMFPEDDDAIGTVIDVMYGHLGFAVRLDDDGDLNRQRFDRIRVATAADEAEAAELARLTAANRARYRA